MTSHNEFDSLKDFLRKQPLNKISISKCFHELWNQKDVKSEDDDCNCLLKVLKELTKESLENERKSYLKTLQNIDKNICEKYQLCITRQRSYVSDSDWP
ncbi:22817_t:CDS:2 [Gigaspora rosea]|nr:22817_t:CDS:2 [Gigaspora rosea]